MKFPDWNRDGAMQKRRDELFVAAAITWARSNNINCDELESAEPAEWTRYAIVKLWIHRPDCRCSIPVHGSDSCCDEIRVTRDGTKQTRIVMALGNHGTVDQWEICCPKHLGGCLDQAKAKLDRLDAWPPPVF